MSNESISVEDVIADVNHQIKRVMGAKAVETKSELVNNVYPLLLTAIEALMGRQAETEEVVAGLLGETESIVQPELADEIANAFNAGRELIAALEPILAASSADEVAKARVKSAATNFATLTDKVETLVAEVLLEDVEGEDGATDDEDEEE